MLEAINHLSREKLSFAAYESKTFKVLSNSLDFSMLLVKNRYAESLSMCNLTQTHKKITILGK